MKNALQRGAAGTTILIIVIILIVAGILFYSNRSSAPVDGVDDGTGDTALLDDENLAGADASDSGETTEGEEGEDGEEEGTPEE